MDSIAAFLLMGFIAFVIRQWFILHRTKNENKNFRLPRETVTLSTPRSGGADPEIPPTDALEMSEDAYQHAKDRDWNRRVENKATWSGDKTVPLPIKSLTSNQHYCLRDAVMKYRIRAEYDFVEATTLEARVKYHPLRTLNSMVEHGFISKNNSGEFTVTDLGCRAFETLPRRYN